MKKEKILIAQIIFFVSFSVSASNLATPSTLIPVARLAVGASYDVGGYTVTNDSIPSIMNRFQARLTFAPLSFLNIGIDAGVTQVEVASDTNPVDIVGNFHGGYGFSGGAHIIAGTPFFYNDLFRIIAIGQGTIFSSSNSSNIVHKGRDVAGVIGFQFHIPRFGYISAGPEAYLLFGENKDYRGTKHRYSNINNLRGWLAIDYFPKEKLFQGNKIFISVETALSPDARFNKKAPLQEIRFSIGFGSVSKRLYGEVSDVEWSP